MSPVKGSPIASNMAQIEDFSSFSGPFFAYNFSPDGARTTRFASSCRSLPAASVGRVSDGGRSRFFRTVVQKPIFARFRPTFFPPPTGNAALPPDAVRRTRGSRPLPSTAGSPTRCALTQGVVSRKMYFFRFSGAPPSSPSRPGVRNADFRIPLGVPRRTAKTASKSDRIWRSYPSKSNRLLGNPVCISF
jgi:hypothetical protein